MNVLIACEYSGIVRDEFIARGHNAISCDLLPTERPGPHYQGNVLDLFNKDWDLIIAHPPCTYLCCTGSRWLYHKKHPNRFEKMRHAADFFMKMLDAPADKVAVENPTMMYKHTGIRKPDFAIHPWQFGDGYTKRTCFWTRNLPPLEPTKIIPKTERKEFSQSLWYLKPEIRGKERSRTFPGIAKAMAIQWG